MSADAAAAYAIVPLEPRHDRRTNDRGVVALDRYLREQAGQGLRRHAASVFVAEAPGDGAVHGFYTLAMASLRLDRLPPEAAARLPRYPTLPAVRLGRLAVHQEVRGRGLGTRLLVNAIGRSLRSEVAWVAFLVEAKDDAARRFYAPFGFHAFADDALHLYQLRSALARLRPTDARGE